MLSSRLFSVFSRVSKQPSSSEIKSAISSLNKNDIKKAIDLLSNKSTVISNQERSKFIDQFTTVLNKDISKNDPLISSSNHFGNSLDGLSNLINNITNDVNSLDSISLKQKINSANNEVELSNIFDSLVHSGNLSLNSFKLIIMNKNCFNLNHFLNKFEFLDPNGLEYLNYKILIVIKASILNKKELSLDLYNKNIKEWIKNLNENNLNNSVLLIKSLYQIIFKFKDFKLLLSLKFNNKNLILLTESLPNQINSYLNPILINNDVELSKNQENYLNLLSILSSNYSNLIKKLVKSSVINKLSLENKSDDNDLTILQYRFNNDLISITEEAIKSINDSKLDNLLKHLKKNGHEELLTGGLLKFI